LSRYLQGYSKVVASTHLHEVILGGVIVNNNQTVRHVSETVD